MGNSDDSPASFMDESADCKLASNSAPVAGRTGRRSILPAPFRPVFARLAMQPWLLYGIYFFCVGTEMYVAGILTVFPRYLGFYRIFTPLAAWLVWLRVLHAVFVLTLSAVVLG